jgi:hypothetical protein
MQIEYAPNRYFDLEGLYKDLFTITAVTMGDRGNPILTFPNERGRLLLNTTDVQMLIKAFGEDSNSWIGREISITPLTQLSTCRWLCSRRPAARSSRLRCTRRPMRQKEAERESVRDLEA